jgi:ribonucleotide reductase alpha subunit
VQSCIAEPHEVRAPDGEFDIESFCHAVSITITAQEIEVDNASYPTPKITQNSFDYRPLGLGYANLGALLMGASPMTAKTDALTLPRDGADVRTGI